MNIETAISKLQSAAIAASTARDEDDNTNRSIMVTSSISRAAEHIRALNIALMFPGVTGKTDLDNWESLTDDRKSVDYPILDAVPEDSDLEKTIVAAFGRSTLMNTGIYAVCEAVNSAYISARDL